MSSDLHEQRRSVLPGHCILLADFAQTAALPWRDSRGLECLAGLLCTGQEQEQDEHPYRVLCAVQPVPLEAGDWLEMRRGLPSGVCVGVAEFQCLNGRDNLVGVVHPPFKPGNKYKNHDATVWYAGKDVAVVQEFLPPQHKTSILAMFSHFTLFTRIDAHTPHKREQWCNQLGVLAKFNAALAASQKGLEADIKHAYSSNGDAVVQKKLEKARRNLQLAHDKYEPMVNFVHTNGTILSRVHVVASIEELAPEEQEQPDKQQPEQPEQPEQQQQQTQQQGGGEASPPPLMVILGWRGLLRRRTRGCH